MIDLTRLRRRAPASLTVRQRIFAGFTVVLLVVAAELAFSLQGLARIQQIRDEVSTVIEPRIRLADELERSVLYRAIAVRNHVVTGEARHLDTYELALADGQAALARAAALPLDPESGAALDRIREAARRHKAATDVFLLQHDVDPTGQAFVTAEATLAGAREDLLGAVRALHSLQTRAAVAVRAQADQAQAEVLRTLLGSAVLVLAALALTAVLTTRAVQLPARRLVSAARALERGDSGPALSLVPADGDAGGPRDELGELGVAFGRMAATLTRREERLAADGRVAAAVTSSLEAGELARAALDELVAFSGADVGAVYVPDGAAGLVRVAEHRLAGSPREVAEPAGLFADALRARRPVAVRDVPDTAALTVDLGFGTVAPREVVAVPVLSGEIVIGLVAVGGLRPLAPDALPFLERAAGTLAIALRNAAAHRRATELAGALQHSNEQLQAQNEELQAQGEELQAQSEELQMQAGEIQRHNADLRESRAALEEKARALEEVDGRKNEFLATLGHELRNPLAAISTAAEVLSARSLDGERGGRQAAVITRQAQQLGRLVDDLLDVARIEHGKIELRLAEVDVREVVRHALDAARTTIDAKSHALVVELPTTPLVVHGDGARLEQVVANLVHNAAKYTPDRGRIEVGAAEECDAVVIRVRDSGIGMEPELLGRVFEPFTQGKPSEGGGQGGLGLGLALVRRLVSMHGGMAEARSAGHGQGSEFVVRLRRAHAGETRELAPAAPRPPEPASPAPPEEPSAVHGVTGRAAARPLRVLVVDDNPDVAETLGELLEYFGHEVRLANDAAGGLRACLADPPDVALLDIGMPGVSGHELARRIRAALPADAPTRLVAVTGHGLDADRERSRRAGFDLHLVKPVGADELRRALEAMAPQAPAAVA